MRKSAWKQIYVMSFPKGIVKVGVTKDIETRLKTNENNTLLECKKYYCTEKCSNPFEIERDIKRRFSGQCFHGSEWIKGDFEEIVDYVKNTFSENAEFIDTTDEEDEHIRKFSEYLLKKIDDDLGEISIDELNGMIADFAESYKNTTQYNIEYAQYLKDFLKIETDKSRCLAKRIDEICHTKVATKEMLEAEFLITQSWIEVFEEKKKNLKAPTPYWED